MKNKKFLKQLENKIAVLKADEIQDIIAYYDTKISKAMTEGKKEENMIEELGDLDHLAKKIIQDSRKKVVRKFLNIVFNPLLFLILLLGFSIVVLLYSLFFCLYVLIFCIFLIAILYAIHSCVSIFSNFSFALFEIGFSLLSFSFSAIFFKVLGFGVNLSNKIIRFCFKKMVELWRGK